ncbi:MAG: carboxypeptidase regulatory-like domain-containing protein [Terriglobia bacterium]
MLGVRVRPRSGDALSRLRRTAAVCWLLLAALSSASAMAGWRNDQQPDAQDFQITVVDENGVAVPSALLTLTDRSNSFVQKAETDYAGRYRFSALATGVYSLRVEKDGFFVFNSNDVRVGEGSNLEVTLNHTQEYAESVNVVYSPPAIDPQKTAVTATLSREDIIDLPFNVGRDIRYALPLLPGVLQDADGQLHVAGANTYQVADQLDGFNVSDPATGLFNVRTSVDSLQSAEVESGRYSAEYGKGSGGVVSLRTLMGDDHFRFLATDFIPAIQQFGGLHFKTWTPRFTFSGPIRKNKAWFMNAADGEYDLNLIRDLPPGANQGSAWRVSNLSKAQVNLTSSNILTASLLVNDYRSDHLGLSVFTPLPTTLDQRDAARLLMLKDQQLFPGGTLLEVGGAVGAYHDSLLPLGSSPYVDRAGQYSGNYFEATNARASRMQGITNLFLPPRVWHGRHEFKVGLDADGIADRQSYRRRPIEIQRPNGTLAQDVTFQGGVPFTQENFESSGYAQDRWSPALRLLVEPGIRFDWDDVVRDFLISPRLAATYLLSRSGDTKLSGGVGVYGDGTNLDLLTRSLDGQRTDLFYGSTGQTLVQPPVVASFLVDQRMLRLPRFTNWSMGVERKMPRAIYLQLQFLDKRGRDGWTFLNQGAALGGNYQLESVERDHYDSVEISARHTFRGGHMLFASYTRSKADSNAVLDFSIDNVLFSPQAGGPLPWDTPNRFLSSGYMPLPGKFTLAYSLDYRDGFPFSLVNENQELVGAPGSTRFPRYFSLDLQFERRIHLFGFMWALRAGCNDITNRPNPSGVNNNVDSTEFLTYGGIQGRAFTARVRLLGRK